MRVSGGKSSTACWGAEGTQPGELAYPYDLAFNSKGLLYVVEYGNHRVQKFDVGQP